MLGLSSALIASIKAGLSASHKVHCINRCVFNLKTHFFLVSWLFCFPLKMNKEKHEMTVNNFYSL